MVETQTVIYYVSLQYYKCKANFEIHTVYHVDMFCGSQDDDDDKRVFRILFFIFLCF